MMAGAILDIVLVALLAMAAGWGFLLNRRLGRLATAQSELKEALATFDAATARADATLKRIEQAGLARGAEVQAAAAKAQSLVTELYVMTAAGERIADRLEGAVRDVRALGAGGKPKRAA
jgi:hypothetical protein